MTGATIQNNWKDFKASYALLTGTKLYFGVGENPPIADQALSEAVAKLLIASLMGLLERAIELMMTVEDYRACGTLQTRLRWLNRDNELVDFDELTMVRRRYEDDMPRGSWERDVHAELAAAYAAIERQLAAWGLADTGRPYQIRQIVRFARVERYGEGEFVHSLWSVQEPHPDDVLGRFIDVMDGERIVSSRMQVLTPAEADGVNATQARLATYERVLADRHHLEDRFRLMSERAAAGEPIYASSIDEAQRALASTKAEFAVIEVLKDGIGEADGPDYESLRQRFNAHLSAVGETVARLAVLPVAADPVGKTSDPA